MSTIARIEGGTLADTIRVQRQANRTQDYSELGRVVWICLEVASKDLAPLSERDRLLRGKIDYMNAGPLLALSRDNQHLLLPFGALPFPSVPDPLWTPPVPTAAQLADINWRPKQCPAVRQSMTERAESVLENGEGSWVIFQPIVEVWYRVLSTPAYGVIKCREFRGTRTALMINVETCEAFFYGGAAEPRRTV